GMLPALHERDLAAFGEALYEFNRRVGEMFRPIQGGIYASPETEAIVHWFRDRGVKGVGQSSWGPTVFAVLAPDDAAGLVHDLQEHFNAQVSDVIVTRAQNQGAESK